jgi:7-cyano-7-deazaguanine synthase
MKRSAVVLLSGGMDSTIALYWAIDQGFTICALTVAYGQRHLVEVEAANRVAARSGVRNHEVLWLPDHTFQSSSPLLEYTRNPVDQYESLGDAQQAVEPTFVAGRNLLFLVLAANRAMYYGSQTLVIGTSSEDFGGYPDCKPRSLEALRRALGWGMTDRRNHFTLHQPVAGMTKAQSIKMARSFSGCMDTLAVTHTCYRGDRPPCGECHACLLRSQAFEQAGVPDPLVESFRK